MNLDSTIADLPETSTIDRLSLEALRSKMEEQSEYKIDRNRFGVYITVCTNDRTYCLPVTEAQIDQLYLIGGDFLERLTEVFQCSAQNAVSK
jgi:hypothetical protein